MNCGRLPTTDRTFTVLTLRREREPALRRRIGLEELQQQPPDLCRPRCRGKHSFAADVCAPPRAPTAPSTPLLPPARGHPPGGIAAVVGSRLGIRRRDRVAAIRTTRGVDQAKL